MTTPEERQEALDYLEHGGAWPEITVAIQTASYAAHRRFREHVTRDDITQLLWEWVWAAPVKIARWHKDNDTEGFQRVLHSVLWDESSFYGRKQKAAALGYDMNDEFYYTKGMIESLLPSVYNREHWINGPEWTKPESIRVRNGKALNEGFEWQATLSDVSRALSRLKVADQKVLAATYRDGLSRAEYADAEGVALTTASTRHTQALRRLWFELGGPKWLSRAEDREPDDGRWPAGRRAMSNAEARALTAREAAFERGPSKEW